MFGYHILQERVFKSTAMENPNAHSDRPQKQDPCDNRALVLWTVECGSTRLQHEDITACFVHETVCISPLNESKRQVAGELQNELNQT